MTEEFTAYLAKDEGTVSPFLAFHELVCSESIRSKQIPAEYLSARTGAPFPHAHW